MAPKKPMKDLKEKTVTSKKASAVKGGRLKNKYGDTEPRPWK